jgi:hypothetical protein
LSCRVSATGIRTELPQARLKPVVGEQSRQAPPKPRAGEKRPSGSDLQIDNPSEVRDRRDSPRAVASKCVRTVTRCHRKVTECHPPFVVSHVAATHHLLASDVHVCLPCREERWRPEPVVPQVSLTSLSEWAAKPKLPTGYQRASGSEPATGPERRAASGAGSVFRQRGLGTRGEGLGRTQKVVATE